jgi:signal transduction histidine kinase
MSGTLVWMVIACVLPAWLGMAVLIVSMYRGERDRAIQSSITTARTLMLAVDRQLAAVQFAMEVLATSAELTTRDLAGFHARASELIRYLPGINIVLTDSGGQQAVNTLRPYGEPLPLHGNPDSLNRVFNEARPVISNLFAGPVTRQPIVIIEVPVIRDGVTIFALAIGLSPEKLGEVLLTQSLPSEWVASIFDASGVIVARNRNARQFVGQRGSSGLVEAISRQSAGFVESRTLEGIPVAAAFSRSELSSWSVAIGLPSADLDRPLYTSLGLSIAGAFFLLLVGLALARFKARQITSDVQALVHPAMTLGRGAIPRMPRLHIREIDEVAQGLARAFRILEYRTRELDRAALEKEAAEKTARLKDEFIGTVSHELRTPLTSIAASLGLLANATDVKSLPMSNRLVAIAHRNCQRLIRLTNDILDVEKLDAGKISLEMQDVHIPPLLEHLVETCRPMAENDGIKLTLAAVDACAVHADADRLSQVFSNLLSNAIKFSPPNGEVVVSLERDRENIRASFRDHGPGIPDSFRQQVFEKFTQSPHGRDKGGTGLGLSIAREIVRRHGGDIGFDDAPGGGTVFFVVLPVACGIGGVAPMESVRGRGGIRAREA